MPKYFAEIVIALTIASALIVPPWALPLQWALSLGAILYRERLSVIAKDDTPDVKRFREELKDLKAKVDAMIIGGRIRG